MKHLLFIITILLLTSCTVIKASQPIDTDRYTIIEHAHGDKPDYLLELNKDYTVTITEFGTGDVVGRVIIDNLGYKINDLQL